MGYVSRILEYDVNFNKMWASAQGYLSRELDAAWPDLADAGIVMGNDQMDKAQAGKSQAGGGQADEARARENQAGEGRAGQGPANEDQVVKGQAGGDKAVKGQVAAQPPGGGDGDSPATAQVTGLRGEALDLSQAVQESPRGSPREPLQNLLRFAQQTRPGSEARSGTTQARVASGDFMVPVRGTVVYGFGWRIHPIYRKRLFHDGIDIAADKGTPIVSALDGRVTGAGSMGTYGLAVEVAHSNGISTLYAHCSRILVREGQRVARGQKIAEVGSTGLSTGPHLHFEVKKNGNPVDPLGYIKRDQVEGRY
ncbi:MAG TPA: M23 family metallopeptidase [Firmicutes bacterium]|nr:M23 family metallopeptidase [Bacillota bacterium]